jgi:hypothetical protein
VNAARLTSGSGSSSWLTISTEDACRTGSAEGWKEYEDGNRTTQARLRNQIHNWPTVCASEVRQGFQDRSRGMKGSQESLTTAVVKDAANWPTASMSMTAGYSERDNCNSSKKAGHVGNELLRQVIKHGQSVPASSSSLGSRQELWPTPEGMAGGKTSRGGNRKDELLLNGMVKQLWATPEVPNGGRGLPPETSATGQLNGRKKQVGLHNQANGKLNPRWVETLMGLPIGWTMPSCASPQTIAPMSCDCSAMESCLPPQSGLSEFSLAS